MFLLQTSIISDKLCVVVREIKRHGAEVEDGRSVNSFHATEITTEAILARDQHRLRAMVEPLPSLHVIVLGDAKLRAAPPQVPVVHRLLEFVVLKPATLEKHLTNQLRALAVVVIHAEHKWLFLAHVCRLPSASRTKTSPILNHACNDVLNLKKCLRKSGTLQFDLKQKIKDFCT